MAKKLMPYGAIENAGLMNKTAESDPGKLAKLIEDLQKKDEPAPGKTPIKR